MVPSRLCGFKTQNSKEPLQKGKASNGTALSAGHRRRSTIVNSTYFPTPQQQRQASYHSWPTLNMDGLFTMFTQRLRRYYQHVDSLKMIEDLVVKMQDTER
jgi:hypothetical protein